MRHFGKFSLVLSLVDFCKLRLERDPRTGIVTCLQCPPEVLLDRASERSRFQSGRRELYQ
ncbi:MAG: hypothetical protein F6J93_39065 [Oscillatoria sp. SIO1A7]|nr:hypothetical protein [Oscillatoria sp. SIO1A7]